MAHAAFQATYSDWRLIKTRKVVQIVFEVPVEQAGLAYEVLDGMPNFGSEVWCAIARLKTQEATQPRPSGQHPSKAGGAHKSWHEMPAAQQAGILCDDRSFQNFLRQNEREAWKISGGDAASIVRNHCLVQSRADILPGTTAERAWRELVLDYRAWAREPEVVG